MKIVDIRYVLSFLSSISPSGTWRTKDPLELREEIQNYLFNRSLSRFLLIGVLVSILLLFIKHPVPSDALRMFSQPESALDKFCIMLFAISVGGNCIPLFKFLSLRTKAAGRFVERLEKLHGFVWARHWTDWNELEIKIRIRLVELAMRIILARKTDKPDTDHRAKFDEIYAFCAANFPQIVKEKDKYYQAADKSLEQYAVRQ